MKERILFGVPVARRAGAARDTVAERPDHANGGLELRVRTHTFG
jgi:hypothetical protein